jgi:protein tyrosine phosphatase (PTP) superfamily phosphohydrolase (DUF442 family)
MTDPSEIANWRRLDARITTSGQPAEAQLAALRSLGVRHVINLALHDHVRALADEAASVDALGMRYVHIPVDFAAPTEADFELFCAAMAATGEDKVHVHCIVNARVTAFLYRYQREVLGLPEAQARALMDTIWQPGDVWARFIGDDSRVDAPHGPPLTHEV